MSRIGRLPVTVPSGVTVNLDGTTFTSKGPKGELTVELPADMEVKIDGAEITVSRPSESKEHKALHGLCRSLVNAAVVGSHEGYSKKLEIVGVGWRSEMKGKNLVLHLGY